MSHIFSFMYRRIRKKERTFIEEDILYRRAPFYFSTKHHHYSTFFPIFINN